MAGTLNIIWPKTLILRIMRMRARENKVNKGKHKAVFPDSDSICAAHDTELTEK